MTERRMGPGPVGLRGRGAAVSASMVAGGTWCIAGSKPSAGLALQTFFLAPALRSGTP